jgi:hypothetical protein
LVRSQLASPFVRIWDEAIFFPNFLFDFSFAPLDNRRRAGFPRHFNPSGPTPGRRPPYTAGPFA